MSRLKDMYKNEIIDAMTKKFEYKNVMEVPKLDKIVINYGSHLVGEGGGGYRILEASDLCKSASLLYPAVIHRCIGISELLIGLIESSERALTDAAVIAHKILNVIRIGELNSLSVCISDLSKAKVGV